MVGQLEAYQTLSKILEKHSGFCSTKFDVVMDLLTGMKPSANIELVKNRFACLQTLLIHALTDNYFAPPDHERTLAPNLKILTENGRLIKMEDVWSGYGELQKLKDVDEVAFFRSSKQCKVAVLIF